MPLRRGERPPAPAPSVVVEHRVVENRQLAVVNIHETAPTDLRPGALVWIQPEGEDTDDELARAKASFEAGGAARVLVLPRKARQQAPTAAPEATYAGTADARAVALAAVEELPAAHRARVREIVELALAKSGL